MNAHTSGLISFISSWLKRRRLRRQIRTVGRDLVHRHGRKRSYPISDIQAAWRQRRYDFDGSFYALAAFSSPVEFDLHFQVLRQNVDYQAVRADVGDACFDGRSDFTILDFDSCSDKSPESAATGFLSEVFCGSASEGGRREMAAVETSSNGADFSW